MLGISKSILSLIFFTVTFFIMIYTSQYSQLLNSIQLDTYKYPTTFHNELVNPILSSLSKIEIQNQLKLFILNLPEDRYYKSNNGLISANYFIQYLKNLIKNSKNSEKFQIEIFNHEWNQPSIIFKINSDISNDDNNSNNNSKTIVIGCHIDSINFKMNGKAPGVDDNLSGIVTIIQTIENLIKLINNNKLNIINSLEFHFYSAEEIGSFGSIQIFQSYRFKNKEIIAMLQQDMTGFINKSIDEGLSEHFGIINDYKSNNLMKFTKNIIENYCDIPYFETKCGKICSDHISALMFGYPSIYVLESKVELSNPFIHSDKDTIDKINFDHMLQHIKLTLSFAIELSISNEIVKIKDNEETSFKYIDFMILLMMHHTKRFVYTVLMFGGIAGSLYIIIDDARNKSPTNDDDHDDDHDDDQDDEHDNDNGSTSISNRDEIELTNKGKVKSNPPTMAIGFMGGVVLPILLTNAISKQQPNSIYQGKDKGELISLHYTIDQLNRRITNIHNLIDHVDIVDDDYDYNDLLF
ncbi:Leucine aminopeptidase 1 [Pichia californica]|nr:Leucine aminopeptidase 1 [[Candida] californica]